MIRSYWAILVVEMKNNHLWNHPHFGSSKVIDVPVAKTMDKNTCFDFGRLIDSIHLWPSIYNQIYNGYYILNFFFFFKLWSSFKYFIEKILSMD